MPSFGEKLRRERELRGIALEDISESTKIGKRNLQALECEEFNKLPGGIFNKGFVRAYAKYLGIDEEQAVTDFLEAENAAATGKRPVYVEAGAAPQPVPENPRASKKSRREERAARPAPMPREPQARAGAEVNPPLNPDPTANRIWIAVAIVALALTFLGWKHFSRRPAESTSSTAAASAPKSATPDSAAPPLVSSSPQPTDSAAPSIVPGIAAPSASPSALPLPDSKQTAVTPATKNPQTAEPKDKTRTALDGIGIRVRATDASWIQVSADGKILMDGVLNTADEREFKANKELVFKTGNAGGVELAHNGKPLGPLGRPKQVKTLTFTPDGLQHP